VGAPCTSPVRFCAGGRSGEFDGTGKCGSYCAWVMFAGTYVGRGAAGGGSADGGIGGGGGGGAGAGGGAGGAFFGGGVIWSASQTKRSTCAAEERSPTSVRLRCRAAVLMPSRHFFSENAVHCRMTSILQQRPVRAESSRSLATSHSSSPR